MSMREQAPTPPLQLKVENIHSASALEVSNNIRSFLMTHEERIAQAAKSMSSTFGDTNQEEDNVPTVTAISMGPGESLPGDRIAQLRSYIEATKEEERIMAAKGEALAE